jgi:hypothetical protein
MGWLSDRFAAITGALGDKGYRLALSVKGALGVLAYVLLWWFGHEMTLTNQMLAGLAIALFLLFWVMLDYAARLQKQLQPKLEILFDRADPGYVHETSANNSPEERFLYVAVRPKARTAKAVTGCVGYLDAVWKQSTDGAWQRTSLSGRLQLEWGGVGRVEQRIDGSTFQPLNVFCTRSRDGKIVPTVEAFNKDRDLFDDRGATYRFDIVVTSHDAPDATTKLRVQYGSDWKSVNVEQM